MIASFFLLIKLKLVSLTQSFYVDEIDEGAASATTIPTNYNNNCIALLTLFIQMQRVVTG